MPRSAPGSELTRRAARRRQALGFTLIELMVVVALIAVAAGVASLALRNPADAQLEREATRLSALLEAARAESRTLGIAVAWAPVADREATAAGAGAQFRFRGLPEGHGLPLRWLDSGISVDLPAGVPIVLGPEPLIGPQRIVLRLDQHRLALQTDGLGPFEIQPPDDAGAN